MRVLHLHSGNLYGGIEAMLGAIARGSSLCPEMSPHFALCFSGRLEGELRDSDVPLYSIGPVRLRSPLQVLRARKRLRSLLANVDFDIVVMHSCWTHVLFAPVLAEARIPYATWFHAPPGGRHWLERWARRSKPNLAIANSRFTSRPLETFWADVPVAVVYPPLSLTPRKKDGRAAASLRRELTTPEDAVVILMASRMESLKGHQVLLESLASLSTDPRWVCWIAGGAQRPSEVSYERELHEQALRLGIDSRIYFLGQRDDIEALMNAADLFCQPNTAPDSFGVVFVEAMSRGLTVVTSAIGGALEIIDSACGRLVPPGDAGALAAELSQLVEDGSLRDRLAEQASIRVRDVYDERKLLHRLSNVLRSAESGADRSRPSEGSARRADIQ